MGDTGTEKSLHLMTEILKLLRSTNQHEQVFHLIVDRIIRIFKCRTCALILIDPKTEYLRVENSQGLSLTFQKSFRRKIATGAVGNLLWTGRPILIADSAHDIELMKELQLEHPFASCACVQLSVDHKSIGYLYVDSAERGAFKEEDIEVLQAFADFASVAYEKCRLAEENMNLDRIDHETGLEKYAAFIEKLEAVMERAKDFNENFAVMICDVDNFKHIAHTYGYHASKQLLQEMGDLVKSQLRAVDAAGRYGYDEFVLLRANTSVDEAIECARKLCASVEHTPFTGKSVQSTVSIGVATYPQNGRTLEDILLSAKQAVFEAQRAGRNNVIHLPGAWYEKLPEVVEGEH